MFYCIPEEIIKLKIKSLLDLARAKRDLQVTRSDNIKSPQFDDFLRTQWKYMKYNPSTPAKYFVDKISDFMFSAKELKIKQAIDEESMKGKLN